MRRSQVLLVVLGFLIVTALWWVFLIGPRNQAISDAEDQLFTAEQAGDRLRAQIAQLNAIKEQEISYLVAIGDMETSIPRDAQFDAFLEDLTFLADRTGVDLISVAATPPAPRDPEEAVLFEIAASLSIEGQFFEVLGFLYGLEDLQRLVRVDAVSINPITDVVEDTTTTTTSSLAPGDTTSSTSSTTTSTTLPEGRLRPEPGLLAVNLTATLFTRTPIATPVPETTTTTTAAPDTEGEQ